MEEEAKLGLDGDNYNTKQKKGRKKKAQKEEDDDEEKVDLFTIINLVCYICFLMGPLQITHIIEGRIS
jgi:hypothetical protein